MNRSVIIVEDDIDLRESTVEFLNLHGFDVTGVGSGIEFYQALTKRSFAVAVLDLGLPDQSGYVLAEYARSNTAMGVIILTARSGAEDRLQGYHCGADIYLVKPVDCRELAAAIKNLSKRLSQTGTTISAADKSEPWLLDCNAWFLTTPEQEIITLTAKEFQFIACLASGAEQRASRHEILDKLGYTDDEYTNRALDSLVRRLRRKIEEKTAASDPLKTIHAIGFCFTEPLTTSRS